MIRRANKRWTWLGVTFYLVMTLGIQAMQLRDGGCNGKCACVLGPDNQIHVTEPSVSETSQLRAPGIRPMGHMRAMHHY